MAVDRENLKQSFQSLSTRYGGSLLVEKQLLHQEGVTVFIGLGGLGGRAVNAIKAATNEKLDNPDHRIFLAVDTCKRDMESISAATVHDIENPDDAGASVHGCLTEDEKLPLWRETFKIKTLGTDVNSWLNRKLLDEVEVDNKGAQGIRQIGRVMLMANGNYAIVYNKIFQILNSAKDVAEKNRTEMKIYIIAGISGGTGSGTIIDFTYMVKRAISGFPPEYKKIDAIIFTPDVQYNDKGIDDNKIRGLKANFYAAIKEVDFFFNNKARNVSYECPYTNAVAAYEEDIFDFCTLISRRAQGIDVSPNSNGVIKKLADALTFEISGITGKTNRGDGQSYVAFFSNVYDNFKYWWPANSNNQGLNMPDWAPSRYSSLAYSSFYIPRDELVAYCANRLMERLAEQWKKNDITAAELTAIFRNYHIGSNKSFARKLFELAHCKEMFDVEKAERPVDGAGLLRVKNCESYLAAMHTIAEEEGSTQRTRIFLNIAAQKQDEVFVNPIIALVDNAFVNPKRGPVYAINLLSAGVSRKYNANSGILAWLAKLIADLPNDFNTWKLELDQVYADLKAKAEKYDGQLSIDATDLDSYTNDCRKYGEDLLTCKILAGASDYLTEIYNKLNEKNNRVFQIYTYTFEYLVEMLSKDSQYVTNIDRHREGQTTVFSFDLSDFQKEDKYSARFRQYFDSFINNKDLNNESEIFVNSIFGSLKNRLDPVVNDNQPTDVQPKEIISIIRNYFNTSFIDFVTDVIEKFCVVAYSTVDATPAQISAIWNNNDLKSVALNNAATTISTKIMSERKIMITCADPSRDLQNFCSYETFAVLPDTPNINNFFNSPFILQANWSEFIGFKRIFGFPLNLLSEMKDFKKEYDAQAIAVGIHLDEMCGSEDDIGDWRYALPEPYSYPTAKLLGQYTDGENGPAELDRKHMCILLELAKKAKELGLLVEKMNNNADANGNNNIYPQNGQTFYELIWRLVRRIDDFEGNKPQIHANIKNAISEFAAENRDFDFFRILDRAGYRTAEPTIIQWTFERPEYNIMKNRTDFGDDVNFGNFIILLRSNPYWEIQIRKGVELFGKFREIYDSILDEFAAADKYNERINDFMRAIRVGRIVPFYDSDIFTGYRIKVSENPEDDVILDNCGLDIFDKKFLMYHCFTKTYINLNDEIYVAMNTLVNHEFSTERRVDFSKEACENVKWFIDQANTVLSDKELFAHYDTETMKKNFRKKLEHSVFEYSLPTPSMNRTDVDAVINNLRNFYVELRDQLTENLPGEDIKFSTEKPVIEKPVIEKPVNIEQDSNTWICQCGKTNVGKFCQNCGSPRPIKSNSWTCSCGAENTGLFCQNCGTKHVEKHVVCSKCGWEPKDGADIGKFCPMCGNSLN